jgi:hypothetical protein
MRTLLPNADRARHHPEIIRDAYLLRIGVRLLGYPFDTEKAAFALLAYRSDTAGLSSRYSVDIEVIVSCLMQFAFLLQAKSVSQKECVSQDDVLIAGRVI